VARRSPRQDTRSLRLNPRIRAGAQEALRAILVEVKPRKLNEHFAAPSAVAAGAAAADPADAQKKALLMNSNTASGISAE
jgi:hypothetical protein